MIKYKDQLKEIFLSSHIVRFVEGHDFVPVNYRAGFQSEILTCARGISSFWIGCEEKFCADSFAFADCPFARILLASRDIPVISCCPYNNFHYRGVCFKSRRSIENVEESVEDPTIRLTFEIEFIFVFHC